MKSRCIIVLSWASVTALLLCCAEIAAAQETPVPAGAASTKDVQQAAIAAAPSLRLTLEDAIEGGVGAAACAEAAAQAPVATLQDRARAKEVIVMQCVDNRSGFASHLPDHR